jgi:hypothetical protein
LPSSHITAKRVVHQVPGRRLADIADRHDWANERAAIDPASTETERMLAIGRSVSAPVEWIAAASAALARQASFVSRGCGH